MPVVSGCSHIDWMCAGQLVWRSFRRLASPSHHAVRAACMEILPVVEMYCRHELQEECSNLQALMVRFDDERQLQSHELGRSLLFMIRDDEAGLETLYRRSHPAAPTNPFDAVRAGLAAVDLAFVGLRPQQQVAPAVCAACTLRGFYFNAIVARLAIRWVSRSSHPLPV